MKGIVILGVLFFIGASLAAPATHRWTLVPDGGGQMHLVDLNTFEADPEPAYVPDTDIMYFLFTRRNPTAAQRIFPTIGSISASQWSNTAPGTRFVIHGWNQDLTSSMNVEIRNAWLQAADHNVVVVDWSAGSGTLNYIAARNRVGETGASIQRFATFLHSNGFLVDWNRLIVAGHSLGGHVAGFVGKSMPASVRLPAIYALDPAGPLFFLGTPGGRFAADDAIFTESIYTNAGDLGFDEPIAQSNMYPNWGSSQPGCLTGICHHDRSNSFYAESINSNRFVARRCANYNAIVTQNCPGTGGPEFMGGDFQKSISGIFFVPVNANSPFAQG